MSAMVSAFKVTSSPCTPSPRVAARFNRPFSYTIERLTPSILRSQIHVLDESGETRDERRGSTGLSAETRDERRGSTGSSAETRDERLSLVEKFSFLSCL